MARQIASTVDLPDTVADKGSQILRRMANHMLHKRVGYDAKCSNAGRMQAISLIRHLASACEYETLLAVRSVRYIRVSSEMVSDLEHYSRQLSFHLIAVGKILRDLQLLSQGRLI